MKRNLYITILALAVLTGCAKVEAVVAPALLPQPQAHVQGEQEKEIGFNAVARVAGTKANAPTAQNGLQDLTFKAFGLYTGPAAYASADLHDAADYITENSQSGATISWRTDAWKAAQSYYWPKSGNLSFAAYAPATADLTYDRYDKAHLFSNSAYTAGTEDLMVAEFQADRTAAQGEVPAVFHHALSRLLFKVKTVATSSALSFQINVTDITIKGASWTAAFNYNSTSDVNNGMSWNLSDSTAEDKSVGSVANALTTSEQNCGSVFYGIPQSLERVTIEVSYTLKTYNGNVQDNSHLMDTADITETVSLKTNSLTSLNMGTSYIFHITISPLSADPIEFDPAVAEWNDADSRVNI